MSVPLDFDLNIRRVSVSNSTLRTASAGAGPPLLMINGLGATIETWQPLASRLSATRTVIMFDAPGTGWSPRLPRPTRMTGLADIVVGLLDELRLPRVDVLGYSWGGALAQQFARQAPSRIDRLVLAATSPGVGSRLPSPLVLSLMATPARYMSRRYLARIAPLIYGGELRGVNPRHSPALDSWHVKPPSLSGYLNQLYAINTWSSLPWLGDLQMPTLVLQGDDDPLVPVHNGRLMAHRLPDARLEIVDGGGHLWLLTRPDTAREVINRFLE
jgi:poly(3-hydroxyalkanoate) depolymerase